MAMFTTIFAMFASIQHCCYIQFVYCQTSTR